MTRPSFTNPVLGPRIVPQGAEREPSDVLPNGRLGFRVSFNGTFAEHAAAGRAVGLDIGNFERGDDVVAMAPGVVSFVEPKNEGIVRIDHAEGWGSGYAHMDGITVVKGQNVPRGHVIGKVGKRGAEQIHLHFDLALNKVKTDPWPLLEQNDLTEDFEPLGRILVRAGTNLRKQATTDSRNHLITADSWFDLLGVKPDGGRWQVGPKTGSSWYRVRRESDWWVATILAGEIRATAAGLQLLPPADCTAYENRIRRALTALEGFANPHAAEEAAVAAARASLED